MTDLILREDREGVATLILNRPDKMNALSKDVFAALDAHVEKIMRATQDHRRGRAAGSRRKLLRRL